MAELDIITPIHIKSKTGSLVLIYNFYNLYVSMYMAAPRGLEPSRPFGQRILSPLCLPIPPPRLTLFLILNTIFFDILSYDI